VTIYQEIDFEAADTMRLDMSIFSI